MLFFSVLRNCVLCLTVIAVQSVSQSVSMFTEFRHWIPLPRQLNPLSTFIRWFYNVSSDTFVPRYTSQRFRWKFKVDFFRPIINIYFNFQTICLSKILKHSLNCGRPGNVCNSSLRYRYNVSPIIFSYFVESKMGSSSPETQDTLFQNDRGIVGKGIPLVLC